MDIKTIKVGSLKTNCYIVSDPQTKEAIIIDPGFEAQKIIKAASGLKIKAIVLTHGHYDHATDAKKIGAPVWIHQNDQAMISGADKLLKDGDRLDVGRWTLEVIHTPGHTPGCICLYNGKDILFSGDTMFKGDWGRTDLFGGSEEEMQESLKRIRSLPENIKVYPGHGPATTIKEEKYD